MLTAATDPATAQLEIDGLSDEMQNILDTCLNVANEIMDKTTPTKTKYYVPRHEFKILSNLTSRRVLATKLLHMFRPLPKTICLQDEHDKSAQHHNQNSEPDGDPEPEWDLEPEPEIQPEVAPEPECGWTRCHTRATSGLANRRTRPD